MANKDAIDPQGFSPRPTQAPGKYQDHRELFKRAIATPRTCGWLYDASASASSVYACAIGTCGYYYTAGFTYQGCCSFGYSSCIAPTTCYDYTQYTSSRCTGSCSDNDFNLVCSRSAAGRCQTFTYPGRGVRGYGCDTDTESTTTTIYSTFVVGAASGSAFASTFTAFLSSIPAYALTASSTRSISPFSTTRYSGGSSSSSYSNNDSVGVAVLVPVIIVIVIWALGYICCIVLLIILCRRHKRNMTAIDQQNAARASGAGMFANAVPYNGSNVLSPGSHQSTYFSSDPHASTIYGTKTDPSPQMGQTYPAPMSTPPPMAGSPIQQYGQQPAYGSPNTNSVYGYAPAPQQPQHTAVAAPQELYSPTPNQAHGAGFPLPNHPPTAQPHGQAFAYSPPAGAPPGSAVAAHPPTTNQAGNVHEMQ